MLDESISSTPELIHGSSTSLSKASQSTDDLVDCQSSNDDVAGGRERSSSESDEFETDKDTEDARFTNRKAHEALLGTDLVDENGKLKIKVV